MAADTPRTRGRRDAAGHGDPRGNAQVAGEGPLPGDLLVARQVEVTGSGLLKVGRAQASVVAPQVSNTDD